AGLDVPGRAAGGDQPRDGADPRELQPDGGEHGAAVVVGPEPAEHPDPDGGGAGDPQGVRGGAGVRADLGGLLADRAAAAGAPVEGPGADGGVPAGGGCAPGGGGGGVRGAAGEGDEGAAGRGED